MAKLLTSLAYVTIASQYYKADHMSRETIEKRPAKGESDPAASSARSSELHTTANKFVERAYRAAGRSASDEVQMYFGIAIGLFEQIPDQASARKLRNLISQFK